MLAEEVERLRRQYTDQYVVVDASRPEFARFQRAVGQVKTVNMSGRALVEFEAHNNRGWYDIEIDCLKVVDKPAPKVEPKAEKKPAAPAAAKARPAGKETSTAEPTQRKEEST
jgi:hypothetical protein